MTAQKFRKKPVVIEAMQWDGTAEGATPIIDWDEGGAITYQCDDPDGCGGMTKTHHLWVQTLEGGHIGSRGDWIVKGVQGEFYPVKESIFRQTYEPVEESSSLSPSLGAWRADNLGITARRVGGCSDDR